MSLDQFDRTGMNSGLLIGGAKSPCLAFGPGCIDALGFGIAGGTHSLDDRINPVVVSFGIRQAL